MDLDSITKRVCDEEVARLRGEIEAAIEPLEAFIGPCNPQITIAGHSKEAGGHAVVSADFFYLRNQVVCCLVEYFRRSRCEKAIQEFMRRVNAGDR
jgi:hypothetical protein